MSFTLLHGIALESVTLQQIHSSKAQKSIAAQKLTKKKKRPPQENTETLPNETEKNDPSYDGYYDDIVPSDIGKHREGIDWVMMKRVGLVAIGVLLIISLCVAALGSFSSLTSFEFE